MADVSVRPARPEDAERVARVQLSTWRSAYADLLPEEALALPLEQVASVWLNAIEAPPSPQHRLLVAVEHGELVGFAASQPAEDLPEAVEVTALLVEPRWGRRGHGSRLLAASVDHWRADGFPLALMWVFETDAVVTAFLESAGWAREPLRRGLDLGPRVAHQYRMQADITEA